MFLQYIRCRFWIHPHCHRPVFSQRKRFGELDFGRYREFLVSFSVLADLDSRVGRSTILQNVLIQLNNSFKARYVADTVAVESTWLLSFSTRKHTFMASRAIFSSFPEMPKSRSRELKTPHNTFRDCPVHFFRQPFSK